MRLVAVAAQRLNLFGGITEDKDIPPPRAPAFQRWRRPACQWSVRR